MLYVYLLSDELCTDNIETSCVFVNY